MKAPIFIGLTGGPGVGKSVAAAYMANKGAAIINADFIGHEILQSNSAVKKQVIKLLGNDIIDENNELSRKKIGDKIFGNPELTVVYNYIIHPPLLKLLKKRMRRAAESGRHKYVVVDAALIYEWAIADWFDVVLVITANRNLRLQRLVLSGLTKAKAMQRLASQMPQRVKVALGDYVIENNSTRRALANRLDRFIERLPAALG